MTKTKYYLLETNSWAEVSSLEKKMQEMMLNCSLPKQEDGQLVSAGIVDVLYINKKQLRERRNGGRHWYNMFTKDPDIAELVQVEFVAKLDEQPIKDVHAYLGQSSFKVKESREVDKATFTFATIPCHSGHNDNYYQSIQKLISLDSPYVKTDLRVTTNVQWAKDDKDEPPYKGDMVSGIITGPVNDVLHLWKVFEGGGYGVNLRRSNLSFSNQTYKEIQEEEP